jgi:asparagine synthase (glutamine-hydrolysing)
MAFVGFRWTPGEREQTRAARALSERFTEGATSLIDWRGLVLLHRGTGPIETLPHGMGFVFGERFGREPDPSPPCESCIDPTPTWIAERWGAYVAVLIDRGFDIVRVLRDPSGARSCFFSEIMGVRIFFSDAEDFLRLAPETPADLGFIRAFLRYPPHVGRRTGLEGVEELAPGECAIYPRQGWSIEAAWTPRDFARANRPLDWREGKEALRSAADATVKARGGSHQRIALRLSGGFDSSVMLGLLRRNTEAEVICVTEYWEGAPEGDERDYARAVAAANEAELKELRFDPARVNYALCLNAPLTVKPTLTLLTLGNRDLTAFYDDLGAGLVTSGQGGDHIFQRSRTPSIAADALCDGVRPGALVEIALDTARLTGQPVWDVLAAMVVGAARLKPSVRPLSNVMGALKPAGDDAEAPANHAWLAKLRWKAPARVLRIHQLLQALSYFDEGALPGGGGTHPLLLSQPIVETCLRIPPYVMTAGGKERSLARAAFADLVPPDVARRVTKGETTRYFAAVLAANEAWIRDVLCEGRLVEIGVIDADALKRALAGGWLQDGMAADGLYALIAAECWLRNLEAARKRAISALAAASAVSQSAPPL